MFALNFSQEYKIGSSEQRKNISEEEHYFDFARDIGLKDY